MCHYTQTLTHNFMHEYTHTHKHTNYYEKQTQAAEVIKAGKPPGSSSGDTNWADLMKIADLTNFGSDRFHCAVSVVSIFDRHFLVVGLWKMPPHKGIKNKF